MWLVIRACSFGLLGLLPFVHASGAEGSFREAASRVSPNVLWLKSCADPSGGQFRVVVFSQGFEHVSSEVFVQWLEWDQESPRLATSVFVPEFGSGFLSVGEPVLISLKTCSMQLVATHTYSHETTRFILRPAGRGRYSIRAVGKPSALVQR